MTRLDNLQLTVSGFPQLGFSAASVPVSGLAGYKVRGQWPLQRGHVDLKIEQQKVISRNEGRS
jgi:hypothetical protein